MTTSDHIQSIVDRADLRKYRTELPNLYDDSGLDTFEFRLLAHYKRVGTCYESAATTAQKCCTSVGKVSETRLSLKEKGWITMTEIATPHGLGWQIEVIDKWEENFARYSSKHLPSPREAIPSPREAIPSPREAKKEPIKNKPFKKDSSADAETRQPSERDITLRELEKQFSMLTGLPLPRRNTEADKKAAAKRWWTPLWNMYLTAGKNFDLTMNLMNQSVTAMRDDKLTISAPQSIEQVFIAKYGERQSGAVVPNNSLLAQGYVDSTGTGKR